MSTLIDELHNTGRLVHRDHYVLIKRQRLIEAACDLEMWEKATGGLPPELVAKALAFLVDDGVNLTVDEIKTIEASTFEVPT